MFNSREQAGELLAQKLLFYKEKEGVIVLGITRGGVVSAKKISELLKVPLDIVVVKKIGAPNNPELAIGAVGPGGVVYWDRALYRKLDIQLNKKSRLEDDQPLAENIKNQKEKERKEKETILRAGKKPLNLRDKTVILVDDGVATGATVLAAQKFLRKAKAKEIILAVPVISVDTLEDIKKYFDKVVALDVPEQFYAVGQFYRDFPQVKDREVIEILRK